MNQSKQTFKQRHRLSMLDMTNRVETTFEANKKSYKVKRNSSIQGVNKIQGNRQSQLNKIIGLAFSKQKSKRSFRSDKENRESSRTISDASVTANSASIIHTTSPKSPQSHQFNTKSKFFPTSKEGPVQKVADILSLQQQFELIIDQPVKPFRSRLTRERFLLLEKLGEGSFSEVYLVRERISKALFALKIIKRYHFQGRGQLDQMIAQLKIQMFCDHPNIVKSYGMFSDQHHLYILQQYAGKQSLYTLMQKNSQKLSVQDISDVVNQLCLAVGYLHKHNIIHRDLKPENILVGPGRLVKLTDFGWSVYNPNHKLRSTFCGTPFYFSPELLSAQSYDESVDIWAIGVMTYEMLTGSNPFGIRCFQDLKKIVSEQANIDLIDNKYARDFVSRLIKKQRWLRTSIADILDHPFLQLSKFL